MKKKTPHRPIKINIKLEVQRIKLLLTSGRVVENGKLIFQVVNLVVIWYYCLCI